LVRDTIQHTPQFRNRVARMSRLHPAATASAMMIEEREIQRTGMGMAMKASTERTRRIG
jgi:hypothetical protein